VKGMFSRDKRDKMSCAGAWWTGVKAQWNPPPGVRALTGSLRAQPSWWKRFKATLWFALWWGMPFWWRRWVRWARGYVYNLWYLIIERFFFEVFLVWLPLIGFVAFLIVVLIGGRSILDQYLKDEIFSNIWGIGLMISALSFFFQYRQQRLKQRAEHLQSVWDQHRLVPGVTSGHQAAKSLGPLGEWLRLGLFLRRRYPLAGLNAEEAWLALLEHQLYRFRSVEDADHFFRGAGLEPLWFFLAVSSYSSVGHIFVDSCIVSRASVFTRSPFMPGLGRAFYPR